MMITPTLAPIPTRTLSCLHCTYRWVTRKPEGDTRPIICPSCRTWGWNTDAVYLTERELARIAKFRKVGKHAKAKKK